MPQKIDVHGLFINPESIIDLQLQKRTSVSFPVFYEVAQTRSMRRRVTVPHQHVLQFDHLEPYGIILADDERPDTASYVVNFKEAITDKIVKGVLKVGKNAAAHIAEVLKIETSGDREFRILQCGRIVKKISIREIPAKVHLLNGQWVDAFKSSPEYDFQEATPYAVTDTAASALMIITKEKCFELFGAGIDATNDEVVSAYHSLAAVYNEIQNKRDMIAEKKKTRPLIQIPYIKLQLPNKKQETTSKEALMDSNSATASKENSN